MVKKKAKKLGARFKHPKMLSEATIDLFWLQGESSINQFAEIDFLKRLYQNELPISEQISTKM